MATQVIHMVKRPDGLTAKQARFVDEYLVDLNGTQAAIRAGYSPKTAHVIATENLRKPKIALRIAERQAERAEKTQLTTEWIVERLIENANRAMQAVPAFDKDGSPTGVYTYEGTVANKALELLGKHRGIFLDRTALESPDGGALEVSVTRKVVHIEKPNPVVNRIAVRPNGNGRAT